MEELALSIDDYFESEAWADVRADLDAEVAQMTARSKSTAERVTRELQALIESLSTAAADSASELNDEMTRIEAEIDRLKSEGHEELADSLRQLLEDIEAMAGPDERAAEPGVEV